ncbi:M56 family metallopeptidase [Prosthecobacter sp.]|uniref:M56 family metallopeptidase n=1 Tax=Prosthecobacter sp. TaxID=1965333 RepID=UPI00248A24AB|nr:M56 family metallopeptidase [Prosthecobacter sp.]MDI1312525.1 M56 family metallopeptidase [Prosthecobacter sp.]
MNALIEFVELWLQSLALLSSKGTLLALVAGLVLLVLHRHLSPAWRHGLWLLVLLRFMVPDLGHFSFSLHGLADVPALFEPAPAVVVEEEVAAEEPAVRVLSLSPAVPVPEMPGVVRPVVQLPAPMAEAPSWSLQRRLSILWLCGVAAVFSVMIVLHLRLQRRIRRDASEAFSEISDLLEEACRLAHVRHVPRLMVTDAVRAPSLFGVLRPVILLPRQVAVGKDAAALKLVLLHELAHLKRHDLWAQIFSSCVIALHWFNPMVWIAARRLRAEAEMAADAHALRCTDASEAHRYGEMLLGFSRYATAGWMVWLASATLLGISENKKDLRRRIEGLMDIARGRRTRWGIGMAAFMVMAVIGLSSSPAEEGKKPSKADDDSATTSVTGIVVDDEGRPVKGAKVRMSINMRSGSDRKEQLTGEEGKFSFEEIFKSASLNLRAEHGDFAESNVLIFQGITQSEERRLVLPQVSWIVGKITDKRDGKPIKDARVFFGIENKMTFISRFEWKHPFAHTNEAGEYRLAVKVRDLNEIIVRAWAPDMAVQSKVMKVTERETTFDAALEAVERIQGKVVNFVGEPVKDAMVWVVEDAVRLVESFKPITLEMMRSRDRVNMASGNFLISLDYSKEDGAIRLPDVEPVLKDKLWIVAMHPKAGFARMRARDLKPGVVFKLERWASMSGRMLRNDGSPVAEATVVINARGDADLVSNPETLKITHSIKFTTDKNGGYKIDHLLPGASFSGVAIDGVGIKKEYLSTTQVTVGTGPQSARQMILGNFLRQSQVGGVRAVQGRIIMPEGYGFRSDAYSIFFNITSNGMPVPSMRQPDPDGRFITEALPPGNYELNVSVMPRGPGMDLPRDAGRWMRFQVEAGGNASPMRLEDIILEKEDLTPKPRADPSALSQPAVFVEGANGKIEITTMDADKKPVAGVKIEVLDFVDHAQAPMGLGKALAQAVMATSDEKGRATLMFPRMPVPGRQASGVQIIGIAPDGSKSRKTELMDGRKAEVRIYPETAVNITIANPIVKWSANSSAGMIAENQLLQGGELRTQLALEHGTHFLLQGTTAEGQVLFSKAIGASKAPGREVKMAVTLLPGVEIEGKIEGVPADYDGTGGVVARVYVKSEGELNQIAKGYPPTVPWTVWAPVGRDGRFHFTGIPRGMLNLAGLGKGWTTRGPLSIDSSTLVNIANSTVKESVTLSARPCVTRTMRILLPDGSPAAGATVQFEWPGLSMMGYSRMNMHAEDAEKYAQFKKEPWTARQAVADDQGLVTLGNRVSGKTHCQVFWTDPKTLHPHSGTAYYSIEEQATKTPLDIQVTEK